MIYKLGPMRESGGTLIVFVGTANRHVEWSLTGNGTLTPINSYADQYGVALAKWSGAGASEDDPITITASQKNA